MALKDRVEAVLNVGLRVPSIMLLDVLYRWDVSSFFQKIQRSSLSNNPLFQYKYLALYLHYVGQCCAGYSQKSYIVLCRSGVLCAHTISALYWQQSNKT